MKCFNCFSGLVIFLPWSRSSVAATNADYCSLSKPLFAMPNKLTLNLISVFTRSFLVIESHKKLMAFIQRLDISQYQLNDLVSEVVGLPVVKNLAYSDEILVRVYCGLGPRSQVERL